MRTIGRLGRQFGLGVWDFLVGDLPEFLVAVFAIVGLAFAIRSVHVLGIVGLPALVVAALATSVLVRGSRNRPKD